MVSSIGLLNTFYFWIFSKQHYMTLIFFFSSLSCNSMSCSGIVLPCMEWIPILKYFFMILKLKYEGNSWKFCPQTCCRLSTKDFYYTVNLKNIMSYFINRSFILCSTYLWVTSIITSASNKKLLHNKLKFFHF